jgi:ATP-dependent Clp protease ATP-binding subunit ClpC
VLELWRDPKLARLLTSEGLSPDSVASARSEVTAVFGPEPADWYHRLVSRGARENSPPGADHFLAILRSADCHAYRALESAGADMSRLRKQVYELLRDPSSSGYEQSPPSAALNSARLRRDAIRPLERSSLSAADRGTAIAAADSEQSTETPHESQALAEQKDSTNEAEKPRTSKLVAIHPDQLDTLEGRQAELSTLADSLLRFGARSPLLVGEHGSGRTLLACHLAKVLPRPTFLIRLGEIDDVATLRRQLARIENQDGFAIIDDLDRMATDQPPEFLSALTQAWATSRPRILTIVNHETRARLDSWLPGVLESLDVVTLPPLDSASIQAAVKHAASRILARHRVDFAAQTHVSEVTRLAERYLSGLAMPGRAIDLLDLAGARASREANRRIDSSLLFDIICQRTTIPRRHLEGNADQELLDLERTLSARVVGHRQAIESICALIRRNRAGFRTQRPILSGLLLGPSGVGKTEVAKALAESLFSSADALLRLDMSEYSESHSVARVVGAPPGYVGHEQGGALTDPMLKQPHRIILLDEIEKAHRDVHQLLLQVFDEGRLTDGRGRTVDFRHALIIMTSNLGAQLLNEHRMQPHEGDEAVFACARQAFPVELWNRIEAPLVLHPLTRDELRRICQRLAQRSAEQLLRDRGVRYHLDDLALDYLVEKSGHDASLGARPLRHLLSREVESLLADAVLRGQLRAGSKVAVSVVKGALRLV